MNWGKVGEAPPLDNLVKVLACYKHILSLKQTNKQTCFQRIPRICLLKWFRVSCLPAGISWAPARLQIYLCFGSSDAISSRAIIRVYIQPILS